MKSRIPLYSAIIPILICFLCFIFCNLNGDNWWTSIQTSIGVCCFSYFIIILLYIVFYRTILDRWIAKGSPVILFIASIIILTVPFAVSVFAEKYEDRLILARFDGESEFLINYYNPFVNPGSFDSRPVSQVLLSILGITLFSGLLVSLLVNYLEQRATQWRKGELHYNFGVGLQNYANRMWPKRRYCVVIGGHESAPGLIKRLVKEYDRIIVFSSRDIEQYRNLVESIQEINTQREKIVFYYGKRDSISDLEHLDVQSSWLEEVFVLGENTEDGEPEEAHDALNMCCVELLSKLRKNAKKLRCYVFFENLSTSMLFQKNDIDVAIREKINLIAFNLYELWAQKVFNNYAQISSYNQFPLNRRDAKDVLGPGFDKHVHFIIIGMTKEGVALALEAARSCHYPNFTAAQMVAEFGNEKDRNVALREIANRRTRITIIDSNAKHQERVFRTRHPQLLEYCRWKSADSSCWVEPTNQDDRSGVYTDIEFEFIKANIESQEACDYITKAINDEHSLVTIASCLTSSSKALAAIMYLPIPQDKMHEVNRLILQTIESSLVSALSKEILPFGMLLETIDLEFIRTIEKRAKRINYIWAMPDIELQKEIANAQSNHQKKNQLDKNIEKAWETQTEPKRWASRYQASALAQRVMWTNYDELGISVISEEKKQLFDGIMERTEHNRWMMANLLFSPIDNPKKLIEKGVSSRETTLLSYRQLYLGSFQKEFYRKLLGYIGKDKKLLTNDQRMIKHTRWVMN